MVAQLDERRLARERVAGGAREENLAAVGRGADARGRVHVDADVVVDRDDAFARVQADAHADVALARPLLRGELTLRHGRRGDGPVRIREHREERVAVGRHLEPVGAPDGRAQHTVVLRERVLVERPEVVEEPRRPFDVREEERDRAGGEVACCHVLHDIQLGMAAKLAPKKLGRVERTVLTLLMRMTAVLMARRLRKALRRRS